MIRRIAIILISLFTSLTALAKSDFDCNKIRQQINNTLDLIDSLRESKDYAELYSEKIDTLNDDLFDYLKILTIDDRFQTCNVNSNNNFSFLLSSDKNFCITSWDTRQGGTMIDYTTTVIYKTNQKNNIKTLKNNIKTLKYGVGNSKILFDTLFTIHNKQGQPIYLACGFGQGSTMLPFRVLKAFMVTDSLIEDFKLFPDNKSELWIDYDYQYFRPEDEVLDIIIINDAKQLKIPIITDNGRPTGKYYKLTFDGTIYRHE